MLEDLADIERGIGRLPEGIRGSLAGVVVSGGSGGPRGPRARKAPAKAGATGPSAPLTKPLTRSIREAEGDDEMAEE